MQSLLDTGFNLKLEKCEFHKEIRRYLGLIVSTKGISMEEDMVETLQIRSQEKKTRHGQINTLCEVPQCLGFGIS